MDAGRFEESFESIRAELTAYLTRLLLRPHLAEELVQETALRSLQNLSKLPTIEGEFRAWHFRVATNLALDHQRRLSTVRETGMLDLRLRAEANPGFLAESQSLRGSPEVAAIAREHLAACLACTLNRFPPPQGAALLLVEMVGFSVAETAEILDARPAQVKGWLTATRNATEQQYGSTCALIAKQGMCHQCVELDEHHDAHRGDPLAGTARGFDDRMAILRSQPPARWTQMLAGLLDEVGK